MADANSIHLSTCQIPKQLSDTISSIIGINSNQIAGLSANYRSLKIDQEKTFQIVPDADFVLQFKNDIVVTDVLKQLELKKSISQITPTSFIFGSEKFNYSQVDLKTMYIGRTDFNKVSIKSASSIFSINGSASFLSKIEGDSFIIRLISIFPAFRAGNNLCNSIRNIDVTVKPISGNYYKINGSIEFSAEKYASIELIRNLLELRQ